MDVQVVDTVGMISGNSHMKTRDFDIVSFMRLVTRPWQKVGTTFGRTKHLLTFKMRN
jgi:hypothetical protein